MQRAFELAELGRGAVSPNPMVGCVIVADGEIIGEGWHRNYGKSHAEVEAVNDAVAKGFGGRLEGATAYVTLEPCSHYGKTPPCAKLLLEQGVNHVVVANQDPNPLVAGRGIEQLRKAGVNVTVGLMEDEGERVNERFFKGMREKRPWVILKWAQSSDGLLSKDEAKTKISGDLADVLVHKWRAEEDAILVGKRTVQIDNPRLNVRHWTGRNPIRVILDSNLETAAKEYHVFDGTQPTVFVNGELDRLDKLSLNRYQEAGNHQVNFLQTEKRDMKITLQKLFQSGIGSILVEGGASVLRSFLDAGCWDEIRVIQSQLPLKKGTVAPLFNGKLQSQYNVGSDTIFCYRQPD